MGYTHYWHRTKELNISRFKLAVDNCKKLCDNLPIPLGDGGGDGEAEFADDCICFNGAVNSQSMCKSAVGLAWPEENAEGVAIVGDAEPKAGRWFAGTKLSGRCVDENGDGSYETFLIEQIFKSDYPQPDNDGKLFSCTKTNFRPYDLNVQCCLIIFKHYFEDGFRVSSDGTDKQWNEARDACQVFLGYGLLFTLD